MKWIHDSGLAAGSLSCDRDESSIEAKEKLRRRSATEPMFDLVQW